MKLFSFEASLHSLNLFIEWTLTLFSLKCEKKSSRIVFGLAAISNKGTIYLPLIENLPNSFKLTI